MPTRDHDTLIYSTEGGAPAPRARERPSRAVCGQSGPGTPADGVVRIWLERHGRNGKPVSIVRGLRLDAAALAKLATRLKRACGTGGTAKDGEIIIQGDHRARIAAELGNEGLRVKLAGG
ncbi:MAG TPA: stress response translation initiation inhibitor YciH [Candidatus Binatia bacterium]|jgi:translation initiation factor 1